MFYQGLQRLNSDLQVIIQKYSSSYESTETPVGIAHTQTLKHTIYDIPFLSHTKAHVHIHTHTQPTCSIYFQMVQVNVRCELKEFKWKKINVRFVNEMSKCQSENHCLYDRLVLLIHLLCVHTEGLFEKLNKQTKHFLVTAILTHKNIN